MNADILRAAAFAAQAHAGQTRKGSKQLPYIIHPIEVGQLLAKAGCPDTVIIAGLLHDVVEDAQVRFSDIARDFGHDVADLVFQLTFEPGLDKATKIKKAKDLTTAAREIKTADLVSNMYGLVGQPDAMPLIDRRKYLHYALEMRSVMGCVGFEVLDVAFDLAYYNLSKSLEI